MGYVVLYMGLMFVGYIIGSKQRHNADKFRFIETGLMVCVFLMVLIMGVRMGSNEEIIMNLGTIGVQSLIVTVIVFVASMLAVTITRKFMKIDKYGIAQSKGQDAEGSQSVDLQLEEETEGQGVNQSSEFKMTAIILISVVIGLLIGYFVVRVKVEDIEGFYSLCGTSMTVILSTMLFMIGIDMGLAGKVVRYMKQAGLKVMVFPLAVLLATTAAGVITGLVFPSLSMKEGLAICYGYGWYTFAPVAIASKGYITASAVSFMHNVFRELGGIILVPVLAKRFGYIEVCSIIGTASMDIGLPIVANATRQDIMVYSFVMGLTAGIAVPVLVPLVIGL